MHVQLSYKLITDSEHEDERPRPGNLLHVQNEFYKLAGNSKA
jgi:hypothetical protein